MVGEFVAHDDSRLRFGSLNHLPGDAINPQRPIAADANTLISVPLLGAQRTWRALGPVLVANDPGGHVQTALPPLAGIIERVRSYLVLGGSE